MDGILIQNHNRHVSLIYMYILSNFILFYLHVVTKLSIYTYSRISTLVNSPGSLLVLLYHHHSDMEAGAHPF